MSFSFKKLFPEDADKSSHDPSLAGRGGGDGAAPPALLGKPGEPTPFDPAGGRGGDSSQAQAARPRSGATAPFAVSSTPSSGGAPVSPFSAAVGSVGSAGDNEFAGTRTSSPFAPSKQSHQQSVSPFAPSSATSAPPVSSAASTPPFAPSSIAGGAVSASGQSAAFTPAQPASSAGGNTQITFGLRDLLSDLSVDVLGFEPVRIPESMMVSLDSAGIVSQVPSGKVSILLSEIVGALDPQFQAAFGNGRMNTHVKIPLQEVYAKLPSTAASSVNPAAASVANGPAMPFAPSRSDAGGIPPFTASAPAPQAPAPPVAASASSSSSAASPSPFAAPPLSDTPKPAETVPQVAAAEPFAPSIPAASPASAIELSSPPPVAAAAATVSIAESTAVDVPVVEESSEEVGRAEHANGDNANTNTNANANVDCRPPMLGSISDDEEILKPLKWDPQAKSTTLAESESATPPPLKMPELPGFDDDESQPLDSLAAPQVETKSVPSAEKSPVKSESILPKGPPLIKKPKAPESDANPVPTPMPRPVPAPMPKAESLSKLPQLGAGKVSQLHPEPAETGEPTTRATNVRLQPGSKSPDFVLRALLGMNGMPTCANVVDHCAQLTGVSDCLVLRTGEVVPNSKSSGALKSVAEGAFEKVTSLVREMGITSADALTIQMDTGKLNFFVDDAACLAILQDDFVELGPGVRERLTLISQQLGTIPLA